MKNIISILIIFATANSIYAQRYHKSFTDYSVGIGLFPTFLKADAKTEKIPLQFSVDHRLSKNFSIGISGGRSVASSSKYIRAYQNKVAWQTTFGTVGLRFAAHTNQMGKWHWYGGTYWGISRSKTQIIEGEPEKVKTALGFKDSKKQLLLTGFIGTQYRLGKRIGIYSELGLGISLINTGLSLRI